MQISMQTNDAQPTGALIPIPQIGKAAPERAAFSHTAQAKVATPWTSTGIHVKQMEEEIAALRSSLICSFNQLLDLKDLNTGVHSTRLAEWALHVARDLGLKEDLFGDIETAALLHDIGKIGVPDSILNKPAKLTDSEYDVMKKHPEYGWAVLKQIPGME